MNGKKRTKGLKDDIDLAIDTIQRLTPDQVMDIEKRAKRPKGAIRKITPPGTSDPMPKMKPQGRTSGEIDA